MNETIEVLTLYHAGLFVVKDVGTEEQREDLKKQILHAKENNIGIKMWSNPGVGDLIPHMIMWIGYIVQFVD